MASNYIQGTGDDGEDLDPGGFQSKFLTNLHARQEAVWAVVCHGRVVVDTGWVTETDHDGNPHQVFRPLKCSIYLRHQDQSWWEADEHVCLSALRAAMRGPSASPTIG